MYSLMLRRLLPIAAIIGLLLTLISPASALAITFDQEPFHQRWMHTDLPVAEELVNRTWVWGPGPNTAGIDEVYAESPNSLRRVQYFDKSRMEITHPDAPVNDLWYVTNGLLVVEMVTGQMQFGDNTFEAHPPALGNVAGDQIAHPNSPTYATVAMLLNEPPLSSEETITATVNAAGQIGSNPAFANAGVTAVEIISPTNHTVASVFWDFMNSTGLVTDGGMTYVGLLFPNAFYATGYPITEAYWTTVPVGGVDKDVLFQCFERRCLTYTPTNEPGWQVEAGNVGMHYYQWRYGQPETQDVSVFLVAIGDNGQSGELIGCGDSLVPITRTIPANADPITGALEALLAIPGPEFGESGLSTALYNWNVTVDSVTVENGFATVQMSGTYSIAGVCDHPRIEAQLEETVLAFPDVSAVQIYVNGQTLESILSLE